MAMNPRDCPYLLDPDTGTWHCPQCGHEYPRPTEQRPRRNCPQDPGWEEALRRQIESRLAEKIDIGLSTLDLGIASRKLEVCFACDWFRGNGCRRWGKACGAYEAWMDRIAEVDGKTCDRWG